MALTTEPTDAEILDLWELFVGEPTEEIPLSDSDKLCFTRAALRSWGQPSGAGEPVAWRYRMKGDLQWQYTERPEQFTHADEVQELTTPQPTQTVPPATQWKDHQTAALVNELRDCAKEFHGTQQLRERLLHILRPLIDWVRAAQAAPPAGREPLTEVQIERAAKKIAECMDYPWGHMPTIGREEMRIHARAVLEAALGLKGGQHGADN